MANRKIDGPDYEVETHIPRGSADAMLRIVRNDGARSVIAIIDPNCNMDLADASEIAERMVAALNSEVSP